MTSLFNDMRLDKRLEKMKEAISQQLHGSLPEIMRGWSELKASYRFLK